MPSPLGPVPSLAPLLRIRPWRPGNPALQPLPHALLQPDGLPATPS